MDDAGIKFLDKVYNGLYMSDIVQHTKANTDSRIDAIRKYLERLEKLHSFATTEDRKKYVLDMYFDKYVVKPENIDEKNIPNGETKESIVANQQRGLEKWLNYLTDPSTPYPLWARYWAFQGMLKMGTYDESKGVYLKRNEKTVANFVHTDAAALAKTIEIITKLVSGEIIDDVAEQKLNKNDSFSKIYTIFLKQEKAKILSDSGTDGKWIKYNQGNKEEAISLSKSVSKYNTGWCTAGEETAIAQVCGPYDGKSPNGGDFYVYYTKDKEGNYSVPRIAIRCVDHDRIGEIRGVADAQNLEEDMDAILEARLKEMTFITEEDMKNAMEKVEGLRELTRIGIKTESKEKLTDQETLDLYTKRFGFGWEQDPRVAKVCKKRNCVKDIESVTDARIKMELIVKNNNIDKSSFVGFLEDNIALVNEFLDRDSRLIDSLPKSFTFNHQELVKKCVIKYNPAIAHATEAFLEDNILIVTDIVSKNGSLLKNINSNFLNKHPELMAIGSKTFSCAPMYFAPEIIEKNMDLVFEMLKTTGGQITEYLPEAFLMKHPEVLMELTKTDGSKIRLANVNFEWLCNNHPEIIKGAAKTDLYILGWLSNEYKDAHIDIVSESIKAHLHRTGHLLFDDLNGIVQKHPELIADVSKDEPVFLSYLPDWIMDENISIVQNLYNENPKIVCYLKRSFLEKHPEYLINALSKVNPNDEQMQEFFKNKQDSLIGILSSKEEWKQYLSIIKVKEEKKTSSNKTRQVYIANKKYKLPRFISEIADYLEKIKAGKSM